MAEKFNPPQNFPGTYEDYADGACLWGSPPEEFSAFDPGGMTVTGLAQIVALRRPIGWVEQVSEDPSFDQKQPA